METKLKLLELKKGRRSDDLERRGFYFISNKRDT